MAFAYKKLLIPAVALVLPFMLVAYETTGPKTAIGGLVGGAIGSGLDAADRRYASQSAQQALEYAPVGSSVSWQNPDSGHYGAITPTRTYQTAYGYCREYQQWVTIGGEQRSSYGTACRQPDGSWRIVN